MAARVLCVDDEQGFVDALAERLRLRGYRADACYDGESALARVREEPFDVLVLDVLMPGRTGLEVIEELAAARPGLQIILLTGQGSVESAVAGMKLGAADYLQKPVDIADLDRALRQALARSSGLAQSRRMMETARLAGLGSLARGVAHEINNPVNIMINNAGWILELLEDEQPGGCAAAEEIKTSAGRIHAHGLRCKQITLGLLKFCGALDTRKRDVDPVEALARAVAALSDKAARLGVTVLVDVEPGLPALRISPAEIDEIFGVLLDNALDAMDGGASQESLGAGEPHGAPAPRGGEARVRLSREGDALRIEVADQGGGIAEDVLPRIFDPFFSTKDPGKGTGLGLAICRRIIDSLGGSIEAALTSPSGSVFRVLLPFGGHAAPGGELTGDRPPLGSAC